MKRFFSFVIKQSVAIVLIVLFMLGFGVFSTLNMSINLLPDINVPMVCVQVIYPGANAVSVEKDVTKQIEDGLSSLGGVSDVKSYSYDNLSALVFSFDYGTDTDKKKDEINSKLSSLSLPSGISATVYDIDLNAQALAVLSVTDEEGIDKSLESAKELAKKISALDGVERTELKGGAEYSYTVKPFGGLELISPLVVQAFSYGALDLPLGNIRDNGTDVQIRNNSDIASVEDIYNLPLELPESAVNMLKAIPVQLEQLKDKIGEAPYSEVVLKMIKLRTGLNLSNELIGFIANTDLDNLTVNSKGERVLLTCVGAVCGIEKTEKYSSYAYYSGDGIEIVSGIAVEVYKANGANSSEVVDKVKDICTELSSDSGFSAGIHLLDDQSEFISDSITNVLVSMVIGGVLAVIIIFLFLKKVRTSLIVAITMPLSVLASLVCLYLLGITLNMVSLGGLAVGIGMLVDNSIVVIECITKHREAGKSAFQAAVDGTTEVGSALFGSTLTTLCVFFPIMFTKGLTAEIFTDLSFAVIFSLTFSLIVAVTVIPALYAMFEGKTLLRAGKVKTEPIGNVQLTIDMFPQDEEYNQHSNYPLVEKKQENYAVATTEPERKSKKFVPMEAVSGFYAKILPKVLGKKLVTILTAVAVFGASIGLLFLTGTEFLPSIDKGQLEITMSYGSGKELDAVQKDVLSFSEKILERIEDTDFLSVSVGKNGMLALTDTGVITLQLKGGADSDKAVESIRSLADEVKPEGRVNVRKIDGVVASLMSGTDDMSVTVVGNDGDTLREISGKIKTELEKNGFIVTNDSLTDKSLQYTLSFDRAKIAEYGLDYQTIVLTLRMGIASYTACTITLEDEVYNLNVCFDENAVTSKSDLENFVLGMHGDKTVKLKDILKDGKVYEEYAEACIRRSNGNGMVSVSATLPDTDTGSASSKMQKIAGEVLKEYESEGYSFEASGISSYLTDAFAGLAVALVISFFLLYAVMAVQFGSALTPLIVMSSIPFSFTGGFLALVITGTSLNVVSFIGLIMLMGVVVNNAIVMLEKIKQLKSEDMPHMDAVVGACKVRLRPILMTTLTTILALLPLAIGIGSGSELMQPLGIVVIGGLLLGTLVTLVLVPAVYCAVKRVKKEN